MALLEAQACGLPVLAGAFGGVAGIVADGKTGFLTEPGDVKDFARGPEARAGERPARRWAVRRGARWSGGTTSRRRPRPSRARSASWGSSHDPDRRAAPCADRLEPRPAAAGPHRRGARRGKRRGRRALAHRTGVGGLSHSVEPAAARAHDGGDPVPRRGDRHRPAADRDGFRNVGGQALGRIARRSDGRRRGARGAGAGFQGARGRIPARGAGAHPAAAGAAGGAGAADRAGHAQGRDPRPLCLGQRMDHDRKTARQAAAELRASCSSWPRMERRRWSG